jgi:hypothetical protein
MDPLGALLTSQGSCAVAPAVQYTDVASTATETTPTLRDRNTLAGCAVMVPHPPELLVLVLLLVPVVLVVLVPVLVLAAVLVLVEERLLELLVVPVPPAPPSRVSSPYLPKS